MQKEMWDKIKTGVYLILLLMCAWQLRITGIDWDEYQHYHPDESYISWVATTIEWPTEWGEAFKPRVSSFNPYYWPPEAASEGIVVEQDKRRSFAYGHLPLYLGVGMMRLAEVVGEDVRGWLPEGGVWREDILNGRGAFEYTHVTVVGRLLTVMVDTATILVLFLLAKALYGTRVGLVAATFLSLNVMHIQLAHFFTFDPYQTLFVVASLYAGVRAIPREGGRQSVGWRLLAGVLAGLAVGSKFSAVLLALPLVLLCLLEDDLTWRRLVINVGVLGLVTLGAFVLTNPFAVIDRGCVVKTPAMLGGAVPEINWGFCSLANISTQGRMVRGNEQPFTRQYIGTPAYWYFIDMQLRWGMGPLLGLVAFVGFGWAIWQGVGMVRGWWESGLGRVKGEWGRHWVVLAWCLPFAVTTGDFFVKFMRYLQPLTPFLMMYGAAWLCRGVGKRWQRGLLGATLVSTFVYVVAFVTMYDTPHPWAEASRWIHLNVPAGSVILTELWDQALPSSVEIEGERFSRGRYENREMTWLSGADENDGEGKLRRNVERLAEGDYLVVASDRIYGVVAGLPERYPLTSQMPSLLFSGELGYELVYVAGRGPRLGGVGWWPARFGPAGLEPVAGVEAYLDEQGVIRLWGADESFTVYDQPLVMVWAKVEDKPVAEILDLFEMR